MQAKVGLGGVAHLDTLIKGAFVEASPGQGCGQGALPLHQSSPVGLALTLKSPPVDAASASAAPCCSCKMVVGSVTGVTLAWDGSEVLIDVNVDGNYAHLVRANSRFWNVSGVKADIGLTGGTIEVETVQSLLAGGIAFNTPEREMGPPSRPAIVIRFMPSREGSGWRGAPHPALMLSLIRQSPAQCRFLLLPPLPIALKNRPVLW